MTDTESTTFDLNHYLGNPWDSTATKTDIYYCFRLLLGRNPSMDEWRWHLYRRGAELTTVVKSYIGSLEFAERNMLRASTSLEDLQTASINGAKIFVHANDPVIGRSILLNSYEPEVVSVFHNHIKPGMTVIDVGANIGFYSILSATLVGTSGRVLAVEPNMANVRLLEASRRLNGFKNIEVAPVAAAIKTGVLVLHAGESNGTTSQPKGVDDVLGATQLVPCVSVDSLLSEGHEAHFVKVDVEGSEPLAIQGMRRLIERCKPFIVSEFSPESLPSFSNCNGTEYLNLLVSMGYSLGIVERDGIVDYGTNLAAVMSSFAERHTDHIDLFCKPL